MKEILFTFLVILFLGTSEKCTFYITIVGYSSNFCHTTFCVISFTFLVILLTMSKFLGTLREPGDILGDSRDINGTMP